MSEITQPVVVVKDLYKSFKLPHEQHSGLKQLIVNFAKRKKGYEVQHVLDDVSFEIEKGEFFGIVGRNGSGKSTLLKLLAGIYAPDNGLVHVDGSLTPFIELGVGFNPELTGRENVFMNGALLGFSRSEMESMYDDIVEFAELERFMDQKLKNYSSGMQVRLAFSIAIRAESEILLLDEVLAVGDEAFQRKCFEYFATLKSKKKTVILVTHDMSAIRRFCTHALLISKGKVVAIGATDDIADKYEKLNMPPAKRAELSEDDNTSDGVDFSVSTLLGSDESSIYSKDDPIKLSIKVGVTAGKITDAFVGVVIKKISGEQVFWVTTEKPNGPLGAVAKHSPKHINLEIQNIFGDGEYSIDVSLMSNDRSKVYAARKNVKKFTVAGWGKNGWMMHPEYKLDINNSQG